MRGQKTNYLCVEKEWSRLNIARIGGTHGREDKGQSPSTEIKESKAKTSHGLNQNQSSPAVR